LNDSRVPANADDARHTQPNVMRIRNDCFI
jgi:hypothetical protein